MGVVHKLSDAIGLVITWLIIAAMGLMSLLVIVEVARRYFFGLSFPWAEELVRYLLLWLTFLGGSLAWKLKGLVCLNLLEEKLGCRPKAAAVLDMGIHIVVLLFSAFIAYISFNYTFSPIIARQVSLGVPVSMSYVYVSIPLGFGLMVFFSLERLPGIVQKLLAGKES